MLLLTFAKDLDLLYSTQENQRPKPKTQTQKKEERDWCFDIGIYVIAFQDFPRGSSTDRHRCNSRRSGASTNRRYTFLVGSSQGHFDVQPKYYLPGIYMAVALAHLQSRLQPHDPQITQGSTVLFGFISTASIQFCYYYLLTTTTRTRTSFIRWANSNFSQSRQAS
jgi:hypothetical protein